MDASLPIAVLYFALKGAAYAAWCGLGVRRFQPARVTWIGLALGLGALRLVLGLGFGVGIFLASMFLVAGLHEAADLGPTASMAFTYLAVYVPVRWIEWALIEACLVPSARSLGGILFSSSPRARGWRLGGAAISCLADVPLMLAVGGLPIGRFMC